MNVSLLSSPRDKRDEEYEKKVKEFNEIDKWKDDKFDYFVMKNSRKDKF